MAKVLELKADTVLVQTETGETLEIRRTGMNFTPRIGEEVAVTKQDGRWSMTRFADDGAHRVNKTAYCLLAIFLGGLGAHKFYARKFGLGFLYLAFSISLVPTVISVVEGILTLRKRADENGTIRI